MTRLQAVGVLLVALGLIYAVLYAAWLRKQRRHASAVIALERERTASGAQPAAGSREAAGEARAQVVAEGTYISTTTAVSRLERVAVEGLGNRGRATLTITRGDADELVRIDRRGEATVVIPSARLVSVERARGMVGKFVGSNRVVLLQWRAENGDIYETGFLPRYKADVDRVESALWWHTGERSATEASDPVGSDPVGSDPSDASDPPPDTSGAGTEGEHSA